MIEKAIFTTEARRKAKAEKLPRMNADRRGYEEIIFHREDAEKNKFNAPLINTDNTDQKNRLIGDRKAELTTGMRRGNRLGEWICLREIP